MATTDGFSIPKEAQLALVKLVEGIMAKKSTNTELYAKMEAIDKAYARYQSTKDLDQGLDATGRDIAGTECCGNVFDSDNIVAPIVVSQVDTLVAYLADVFLSGSPIFPVVSSPTKRKWAEQLETLLDDHAQLGGYSRNLLLMMRDAVKYNAGATEVIWDSVDQFTVVDDYEDTVRGSKVKKTEKSINKIKHLDMYNTVWDMSVPIGSVSAEGDYAGYVEILSKTKLKKLTNRLAKDSKAMNITAAFRSTATTVSYKEHPTISSYITPNSKGDRDFWAKYVGAKEATDSRIQLYDGSTYEKVVMYIRIIPSDYNIKAPSANTPQIWKLTVINGTVLLSAERIISAYDNLPILMCQPMEDGLRNQTQSTAEGSIPFQEGATTLFNIRFAAARRAVSDRALYLADYISPSDVNSKHPAAKIPVRLKALSNLGLDGTYKQIPFDMRGTETTISDARVLTSFSQELAGINNAQQGQFQKGNKSVQEWNDTIGGSDNRLRLHALTMETQYFVPLKQILTLNIFQYGEDSEVVSQKTGQVLEIKLAELRNQVLSFRLTDGFNPTAKVVNMEMLTTGLQLIMNAPILQQAFGPSLPNLFAHMMQLGGVKNLEQYSPSYQQEVAPANLQTNSLTNQVAAPNPSASVPAGSNVVPVPAAATAPSLPVA